MATTTKTTFISNNDTGFGSNPESYGGRFVNRDGSINVRKTGIPFVQGFSLFNKMLSMKPGRFFGTLLLFYLLANLFFTFIYFFIGKTQFQGIIAGGDGALFKELFFFSTETFTTVGYGRVNPVGDAANMVAAMESMLGFLSFAVATGLMYGRFSKPKANLMFSKEALVSPYLDGTGLMFRFVAYKQNHTLTSVEVKVTTAMITEVNGKASYQFYQLDLERSRVDSLPMNFTVVHPITDKSPLYNLTIDDMKKADVEIYVLVRAYDDVYSNQVQQRTSYTFDEIIFGRKFVSMYHESEDGKTTIVEIDRIDEHKPAPL